MGQSSEFSSSHFADGSDWLSGGGEMGERVRRFDWSNTPLGPISSWSMSLRMMVRFLLTNRIPQLMWWGPNFCQIYNDAYRPVLGSKHPKSLGQPATECWSEIWDVIGPLIHTPFCGGPATWMDDISLEVNRHGFFEETHFTIAYSPVPDETVPGGIGGVLATVHEISEKVVGERRMVALRDLGTRAVETKTAEEAGKVAMATLEKHPKDIPFALLYLLDSDGKRASLVATAGMFEGDLASPRTIHIDENSDDQSIWPLAEVIRTQTMQTVDNLADRLGDAVPRGPWSDSPRQAVITPIRSNIPHQLAGVLVTGISARLRLDDSYHNFIELAANQIFTAIANARAYEEERERIEARLEIARLRREADARQQALNFELQRRVNELNTLLDILPVGVWTGNRDCSEMWGNLEAYRIFGLPPGINGSVTAKKSELPPGLRLRVNGKEVPPEDLPMQTVARTGKAWHNFELDIVFPDGNVRTVYGSVAPLFDERNEVRQVIAAYADYTERKRAADAVLRSEERFRYIAEANLFGVAFTDPGGGISYANDAVLMMTGYTREDVESGCMRCTEMTPPEYLHLDRRAFEELRTKGVSTPFEMEYVRKDGSRVPILIGSALMPLRAGRPQEIFSFFVDLTERKHMEEALKDADRRKDEFLAMLAHELRNPLAPIRNAVQAIKRIGVLDPRLQRMRDVIDRQSEHLARLVDDLLDVGRITQGKIDLRKEKIELSAVVARAIETSRPLIESHRHRLTVLLPDKPLTIEGDDARIVQVISNLLNNAAKYTDDGGHIWIRAERKDHEVLLTVRDNGMGIPPKDLLHVFGLFSQAERSLDRAQGGLGIGLTLVKNIVEMHGGRVEGFSDGLGRGSEFIVYFPAIDESHS